MSFFVCRSGPLFFVRIKKNILWNDEIDQNAQLPRMIVVGSYVGMMVFFHTWIPGRFLVLANRCFHIAIFLIFARKHMLWVLIGTVSARRFQRAPQNMFPFKNKRDIVIFVGGQNVPYLTVQIVYLMFMLTTMLNADYLPITFCPPRG